MLKFDYVYKDIPVSVRIVNSSKIFKFNIASNIRLKDIGNRLSKMMHLNPVKTEYEWYVGWPYNPSAAHAMPNVYTLKQCRLDPEGHLSAKLVKTIELDNTAQFKSEKGYGISNPAYNQNAHITSSQKNKPILKGYLKESEVISSAKQPILKEKFC